MPNTAFMREVADYIEEHPKRYDYFWRHCIAGTAVRLAGGRFIGRDDSIDVYRLDMLRPTKDDPKHQIQNIPEGVSRDTYGDRRWVSVEDRAARLFGVSSSVAYDMFLAMTNIGDVNYVRNKHDAVEVAQYLRAIADYFDERA